MRKLLIVMAAIEMVTGLALIASPQTLTWLLLGSLLDAPTAILIARLGGVALISLATACWFAARDENSRAAGGLLVGMLIYNCGATVLLTYAGAGLQLSGLGLWPAVLAHIVLSTWCIAVVMSSTTRELPN